MEYRTLGQAEFNDIASRILYEDNHLLVFGKRAGEIVQGDKTGDECLAETLKAFIAQRDAKPGKVFMGIPHRLDRPVSGICVFAKTSKALELLTGRHHQLRCQLSPLGCCIKGDLKYGAPRSNPDGGICLHARTVEFIHPVKKEPISITCPLPSSWPSI